MSRTRPRLALIDPLTLRGREFLRLLEETPGLGEDPAYFHTAEDDEQQIAELAGKPGLVPPLEDPGILGDFDAVVLAGSAHTPRLDRLSLHLGDLGATLVVDMTGGDAFLPVTTPLLPPPAGRPDPPVIRVPHPGIVAARAILDPLADLGVERVALHVVEPASVEGRGGVEELARQAAVRLRGEPTGSERPVLAFNLVTGGPGRLAEEAVHLLDPLGVAVTRAVEGRFHGHVLHLGIFFGAPVEYGEIEERWAGSERLAPGGDPLDLDAVPDSRSVHLAAPMLSRDGRTLAVTAAADGLLVGGALTALELLTALL